MKVYQRIAQLVQARKNCIATVNTLWQEKHEEALHSIAKNLLPHGSGIDCGTKIDIENSTDKKIILTLDFHFMDDNGYYDGWGEFKIIVTPSFNGIDMKIIGRDRRYIKDYLYDLYDVVLSQELKKEEKATV